MGDDAVRHAVRAPVRAASNSIAAADITRYASPSTSSPPEPQPLMGWEPHEACAFVPPL